MEEGVARGDVPQRWRLEQAAIGRLLGIDILAQRAADAEIESVRVGIGRDGRVARHAERLVFVVGEDRRRAVGGRLVEMASGAIALLLIVEKLQAARFGRRQRRLTLAVGVVFAGEGMEGAIFRLKARQGEAGLLHSGFFIVEHCRCRTACRSLARSPP